MHIAPVVVPSPESPAARAAAAKTITRKPRDTLLRDDNILSSRAFNWLAGKLVTRTEPGLGTLVQYALRQRPSSVSVLLCSACGRLPPGFFAVAPPTTEGPRKDLRVGTIEGDPDGIKPFLDPVFADAK